MSERARASDRKQAKCRSSSGAPLLSHHRQEPSVRRTMGAASQFPLQSRVRFTRWVRERSTSRQTFPTPTEHRQARQHQRSRGGLRNGLQDDIVPVAAVVGDLELLREEAANTERSTVRQRSAVEGEESGPGDGVGTVGMSTVSNAIAITRRITRLEKREVGRGEESGGVSRR
jgi:hypothetical protein